MLLTKECDYGIRIIRALKDGEKRTVQTICDQEHVPNKYAYKILKKLQMAKLVQNKRGPDGGYFLIKALNSFTIYDVVTAIDKKLFLFDCLREDAKCPIKSSDNSCTIHHEFVRLQSLLVTEMKVKTMEELLFT